MEVKRDHPRGCGEKSSFGFRPLSVLGSSPRVRGKGVEADGVHGAFGIIPAGAGKSTLK